MQPGGRNTNPATAPMLYVVCYAFCHPNTLKMKTFYVLLLSLTPIFAFSQENNDLPERKPFVLKVPVDKSSVYVDTIKATPFIVHADIIQIYPGETIYVEAEEANGIIKSLKTVKENKNPNRTITISFTQVLENGVHQTMMLKANNPFKKNLNYSAKISIMNSKNWVNTDVLPIRPGLSTFETWPNVIVSIALYDWKLANN